MRHGFARRAGAAALVAALATQLASCGTVIYPERRGQPAGKLDTDVVILDGIGLLLFLVPGVIAFGVDFATGAIYLPSGDRSRVGEVFGELEIEEHRLPGRRAADVEASVLEHTGLAIDLDRARRLELPDDADVEAALRAFNRPLAVRPG